MEDRRRFAPPPRPEAAALLDICALIRTWSNVAGPSRWPRRPKSSPSTVRLRCAPAGVSSTRACAFVTGAWAALGPGAGCQRAQRRLLETGRSSLIVFLARPAAPSPEGLFRRGEGLLAACLSRNRAVEPRCRHSSNPWYQLSRNRPSAGSNPSVDSRGLLVVETGSASSFPSRLQAAPRARGLPRGRWIRSLTCRRGGLECRGRRPGKDRDRRGPVQMLLPRFDRRLLLLHGNAASPPSIVSGGY